ncbi:hypothetical protein SSBR45G_39550 [Bradyrhizobium sp. SSBR45G]|nr:hypothetical protein SSBR45G_39550 [Bradyrhizobium sp. SSBR45G]GLH86631.1 hypothetical protein SSBR45R_40910 [Bradyrhizobium sp. SSBR45R]
MCAALLGVIAAALLAGCRTTEQAEFLGHSRSGRAELLASYPREQKWRMFKLILASLATTDNDLDYRDALQVFAEMERSGTYRVCADGSVLAKMAGYRDRIRDAGWREVYGDMLRDMCRAKPAGRSGAAQSDVDEREFSGSG